ncbi:MAG: c-type cytochrome [Chromatiales bacterium]|nr:c-type cytochrome [Chromatiales bacterium]
MRKFAILAAALLGVSQAALADPAATVVSAPCAGCHGTYGDSAGDAPVIAGQSEMYLVSTMTAYRDGTRYATIMDRIAKGYDDAQIKAMSGFFAAQTWPKITAGSGDAARGQQLHTQLGCLGCHGPTGIAPSPLTPRIAGQYAGFLAQQMRDYKDASKPVSPSAMTMRFMLGNVSDADIDALAAFYSAQ